MKFSKKAYRNLGFTFQITALITLVLTIVLLIINQASIYFGGFFLFMVLIFAGSVFHDKANYWKPVNKNNEVHSGLICNLSIQSGEKGYKIQFDLKDATQIIKEKVVLLTRDKLLADSFKESGQIQYSWDNDHLYFPEIPQATGTLYL